MTRITYAVNHCQALVSFRDIKLYQNLSLFIIPVGVGFYIIYIIILCLCNSGRNKSENWNFTAVNAYRPFYPQVLKGLSVSISVCLSFSHSICLWVCVCVSTLEVVRGNIICFSYQKTDANLSPSVPCLCASFSLPPPLSLPLICLSQSIQLYVVGMLEVPGEPSLVLAIQTATLHLSTVPGLLKSATGKARDTH